MKTKHALEEAFIDSAIKHGKATEEGNPSVANTEYDRMTKAAKDIKTLEDKGVELFKKLLSHDDYSVIASAAYQLLPFCEEDARNALIKVDKEGSPLISFSASMVLREWDAGRLDII